MELDLQEQFMELATNPFAMIVQTEVMFKDKARIVRYKVLNELLSCKASTGDSVDAHVLKMKGRIELLAHLGHKIDKEMSADVVLRSLPRSFSRFIMN